MQPEWWYDGTQRAPVLCHIIRKMQSPEETLKNASIQRYCDSWYAKLQELEEFIKKHDRLPTSMTPDENRMRRWLDQNTYRYRVYKNGLLPKSKFNAYACSRWVEFARKYSHLVHRGKIRVDP